MFDCDCRPVGRFFPALSPDAEPGFLFTGASKLSDHKESKAPGPVYLGVDFVRDGRTFLDRREGRRPAGRA